MVRIERRSEPLERGIDGIEIHEPEHGLPIRERGHTVRQGRHALRNGTAYGGAIDSARLRRGVVGEGLAVLGDCSDRACSTVGNRMVAVGHNVLCS